MASPSASYSFTIRVVLPSAPGSFAQIAAAIGASGGDLGAIDLVRAGPEGTVRDVTVNAGDSEHGKQIVDAVRALPGVDVQSVSDRTFLLHLGGKIEVDAEVADPHARRSVDGVHARCRPRLPRYRRRARAGVVADDQAQHRRRGLATAPPCSARRHRPRGGHARDGGQGDAVQGVRRGRRVPDLPRDEGHRRDRAHVKAFAPGFGGINLEDISAPRCFEIEGRLRDELDIPVFHDDQHGTAVVVLAAFLNALRVSASAPRTSRS